MDTALKLGGDVTRRARACSRFARKRIFREFNAKLRINRSCGVECWCPY